MNPERDCAVFRSFLMKGQLRPAMDLLSRVPEQGERYARYVSRFQNQCFASYDAPPLLNDILLAYQQYFRDVFFLELPAEEAAQTLASRLAGLLHMEHDTSMSELEDRVSEAFSAEGLHFLGGRTGGFYGPYVWRDEELKHYGVELPGGNQDYAVLLLDGFLMNSWLDYISFGDFGTGGWAPDNGPIHCIRSAYDLESEAFQVSLLKHEAQHVADKAQFKGISVQDLEYRAKLVELIYSRERNLLPRFAGEADPSRAANGHGLAACRIVEEAESLLGVSREAFADLPTEKIQAAALTLFSASNSEAGEKYTA